MEQRLKGRIRWMFHVVLAVLGAVAVVLLVRHVGARPLAAAMVQCAPILPIVFGLEIVRTVTDAWRTQLLYGMSGKTVPFRRLLPVQIASYPMTLLLPAGGAASEAYKATILSRDVGVPIAAAAATTNQSLQLFAVFLLSIPCSIVAFGVWGISGFTIAIIVQALTAAGLGVAIQVATRHRMVGSLAARVWSRAGAALDSHRAAVALVSFFPLRPLGAAVVSRVAQLLQYGLLVVFAGASPWLASAFLALGVQLVSGAAGDLIPAQIGATDATFALAAKPLGIDPARALSIAVAMHVVQIAWAILAMILPLGRSRPVEDVEPAGTVKQVS